MRIAKQHNRFQVFFKSKVFILLLLVVLVFCARGAWRMYGKMLDSQKNYNRASAELSVLQERKNKVSAELSHLNTESGIDSAIRERFSMAKSGEKVIVILDKNDSIVKATTSVQRNWWQKVVDFFSKKEGE
jgi:cell division protein FtsB